MFLIRRILVVIFAVLGGALGIIFFALINSVFHLNYGFSQVSVYGLIAGVLIGIASSYLLIGYIIRRAKRTIQNKLLNTFSRFSFLRR